MSKKIYYFRGNTLFVSKKIHAAIIWPFNLILNDLILKDFNSILTSPLLIKSKKNEKFQKLTSGESNGITYAHIFQELKGSFSHYFI